MERLVQKDPSIKVLRGSVDSASDWTFLKIDMKGALDPNGIIQW